MSLFSISSHQASIGQHFRDTKFNGSQLYQPSESEQKLSYINESSREEDSDSSDDEAVDKDQTPEYEYDDFVRDFGSIAADAREVLSVDGQIDDEKMSTNEDRPFHHHHQQYSSFGDAYSEVPSTEVPSKESCSTIYEIPSAIAGNHKTIQLSPAKSNDFSSSECLLDRSHPYSATTEVSRAKLEEKLRGIGVSTDCGSSVATSELGSILSRESQISKNYNIPRMIFHRTHPPNRLSDSARSSPTSMGNTYENASTLVQKESPQVKVESPRSNLLQPQIAVDPTEDVIRSQLLRRENSAATSAAIMDHPKMDVDPNEDVIRSQRLLRNNVASVTSSVATIEDQLSRLRSFRATQMRNRVNQAGMNQTGMNKTTSREGDLNQPVCSDSNTRTGDGSAKRVQSTVNQMHSKHDSNVHSGAQHSGAKPSSITDQHPVTVSNGVEALKMRYQQFMSTTSSGNDGSRYHNNQLSSSRQPTVAKPPEIDKISTFWKQLKTSSVDLSVDKPRPNLNASRHLSKKLFINDARKYCDDASQQSAEIFEIAPRGSGYGVLNRNQWIKDEMSCIEDQSIRAAINESASHHAFEVTPLSLPSHECVVAKLPSQSKLHRPRDAVYRLNNANSSPTREGSTAGSHHLPSENNTPSEYSRRAVAASNDKPRPIGSRVASSPFIKTRTSISTSNQPINKNTSPTKSVMARANVFSTSWKSASKKPPTVTNRSVSTEKLNAKASISKKKDSSWIARGRSDRSWIQDN
jgi:hypothetical protein